MFEPGIVSHEIHQKAIILDDENAQFLITLSAKEKKSIEEAIQTSQFINEQIPTLEKNNYLEKKRDLIAKAIEGLKIAKSYKASELTKICNPCKEGRILSETTGVYKKDREIVNESLAWELSIILGCDQFIAPSLPIYIHEGEASFQPYFHVSHLARFIKNGQKIPVKISLEDYWILTLYTLLIGHSDLNGENVHFAKNQYLLLDNDCSFPPVNSPTITDKEMLWLPLQNVFLDFDYAQKYLNKASYKKIKSTLNHWKQKEKEIETFFSISPLAKQTDFKQRKEAFWQRWKRIVEADLPRRTNLKEFVQKIFPEHFKQIETAQKLASEILGYSVGPMSALHLLGPFKRYYPIEKTHLKKVSKWIKSNHT